MTWDEIKEIEKEIGYIGHHSHTHEYLLINRKRIY